MLLTDVDRACDDVLVGCAGKATASVAAPAPAPPPAPTPPAGAAAVAAVVAALADAVSTLSVAAAADATSVADMVRWTTRKSRMLRLRRNAEHQQSQRAHVMWHNNKGGGNSTTTVYVPARHTIAVDRLGNHQRALHRAAVGLLYGLGGDELAIHVD